MTIELRLRTDGEPRVLRLLSSKRETGAGRACFSALLDITAESAAERQRQPSDRLRRVVLDALPAEVAVLDGGEGRIVAVNAPWRRFAEENQAPPELRDGLGIDYLAACRSIQTEDPWEAAFLVEGLAAVLAGRAPAFAAEYPCHAPECLRWFALTAAPLAHGESGAVVVHFDITERKLAEDRARRGRDQAAQAAQQGEGDPEKLARRLAGIDGQIRRAANILERLRTFPRGREMHMQPTPIDEIVAQAMVLVRWFAADRQVRLSYGRPVPGVEVAANALQIGQVLVNLTCNGVQAIAAAKSPRREVAVAVDPRPDGVEVSVRDTGPGLLAECGHACSTSSRATRIRGWAWGSPSAAISSRPTAAGCGPSLISRKGRSSASPSHRYQSGVPSDRDPDRQYRGRRRGHA